jgi:hypothetical protein
MMFLTEDEMHHPQQQAQMQQHHAVHHMSNMGPNVNDMHHMPPELHHQHQLHQQLVHQMQQQQQQLHPNDSSQMHHQVQVDQQQHGQYPGYNPTLITPMMLEDPRLQVFRKLSKTLKPAVLLKSWQRICMLIAGIETTRDCGQANIATLEKEIYDRYHGNMNRDPPIIG